MINIVLFWSAYCSCILDASFFVSTVSAVSSHGTMIMELDGVHVRVSE